MSTSILSPNIKRILIGFLVCLAVSIFFMFLSCKNCFTDLETMVKFLLISMLWGMSLFLSCAYSNQWLAKKINWLERPWTSFFIVFTANIIVTVLVVSIVAYVQIVWISGNTFDIFWKNLTFNNYAFTLIVALFITSIFHSAGFLSVWKESMLNAERLKQAHLQSQLETLNSQVNPHFLFNSLNVLSTLVRKDVDKADQFIHQLATVYRNLLDTRTEECVTLKRELKSLESYQALLETRFGDRLQIVQELPANENHFIVPFALQLLLENAVKHNSSTKDKPLVVKMYIEGDFICVENNKQALVHEVSKGGIGLKNLHDRYHYLNEGKIKVEEDNQNFKVSLPLITD